MNVYDALPYPSLSYAQTHPDRLATLGTLLGMSPAPVERCRVLELGCAGGGNLIPMAYGLPGSRFVGVDGSEVQITAGRAEIAALGLKNVTLEHLDILDVGPGLGEFDYIIAHGVYSWVPQAIQDKILQICKQNLAPNGVSYVSYNTYPGWHMINIVRGLMLFHSRNVADPGQRAAQGRAGLRLLADMAPGEDSAYGNWLRMYVDLIDGGPEGSTPKSDSLLYHDELEEVNDPVYFYQFVERAARHGLQYLADFHHSSGGELPEEVTEKLQSMAHDHVELEQYLDFLQNRTFRQTLLCHDGVRLNRSVRPEQARTFYAASRARSLSPDPALSLVAVEKFEGDNGAVLSIDHPVSKAAMLCLAEAWPRFLAFDELLSAARARLAAVQPPGDDPAPGGTAAGDDVDAQVLGANLIKAFGYSHSLVELHVHRPPIASLAGEHPVASAAARLLAGQDNLVTNLRHERITLDPLEHYLLPYLDGSRDREALLELLLAGPVADGRLTIQADGEEVPDPREVLAVELENSLAWLARVALLVDSIPGERMNEPRQ